MKIIQTIVVSCLYLLTQHSVAAKSSVKVLFIGNSQMMVYDLPRMMEVMSESAPADHPRLEIGRRTVGGTSLKTHWEAGARNGTPRAMIAAEKWDYVVIQELFNANEADFEKYAELFDDLIRKSGAKTILFATANVTAGYHVSYMSFTYPEAFQKLNGMQIAFGKKRGIPVAAAGHAWMKYLGPNPSTAQLLDLYHKDKGHPGAKGTYIYCCVLYAHITGLNPASLVSEFKGIRDGIVIPKDEAAKMQKAAWEQYQEDQRSKFGAGGVEKLDTMKTQRRPRFPMLSVLSIGMLGTLIAATPALAGDSPGICLAPTGRHIIAQGKRACRVRAVRPFYAETSAALGWLEKCGKAL